MIMKRRINKLNKFKTIHNFKNNPIVANKINSVKKFYICSYGGCGSKYLCDVLKKYGKVFHVHSRYPPNKLEFIGDNKEKNLAYKEYFCGIPIPEDEINQYYVIYIYRNPIDSIISRFLHSQHLKHIECESNITIDDVINQNMDLYKIEEFYNNYITKNPERNYKIICIKYEELFDIKNQLKLSKILEIDNLNLIKKESNNNDIKKLYYDKLYSVYKNLIDKMNDNEFLFIN